MGKHIALLWLLYLLKTTSTAWSVMNIFETKAQATKNHLPEEVRDLLYAAKQVKPSSQYFSPDFDKASFVPCPLWYICVSFQFSLNDLSLMHAHFTWQILKDGFVPWWQKEEHLKKENNFTSKHSRRPAPSFMANHHQNDMFPSLAEYWGSWSSLDCPQRD